MWGAQRSKRANCRAIATIGGVIALAMALGWVVDAAGAASRGSRQPLAVQSASLVQEGQDLVWQVGFAQSFSPGALAGDGRPVCLLIERAADGSVLSRVCLAGPKKGARAPRLMYAPAPAAGSAAGSGAGSAIAATITRSSARELTAAFLPGSVGLRYQSLRWQVVSSVRALGCAPVVPGETGCASVFPAKPVLVRLHTPRLVGCEAAGPDWVFHGPTSQREIALTFDDGPWWQPPATQFVRLLAREHAPATFFEVGEHIATYDPHGTIEREMLADGDMIGDHTWTHPNLLGLSPAGQQEQIGRTAAAIRNATGGFQPCLFRAPEGAADAALVRVARSMGFATIQWDVDPRDWALPGTSAIVGNVVSHAHDGAIVIQHFGGGPRYETLDALTQEITELRAKGYQLVTLTQMLGYKLVYR